MTRADIHEALDVRGYERVVVVADPETDYRYPDDWHHAQGTQDPLINDCSVVVVDRVDLNRRSFAAVVSRGPRLVAVAPDGIEHEKSWRRFLSALYPFTEVWTFSTSFGKVLVGQFRGEPYDRDLVIDERPGAQA